MGKVVQLNEFRVKLAEIRRVDTLQQARDLVQDASLLLSGLGGNYQRIAWLLEDSLRLIDSDDSEDFFPDFSEKAGAVS